MVTLRLPSDTNILYPVGLNMQYVTYYLENAAHLFKEYYPETSQSINLICRGSSGAILAGIFYMFIPEYNVEIHHVKKPKEKSHSHDIDLLENGLNVIIDDFICTGETVNAIYDKLVLDCERKITIDCLIVQSGFSKHRVNFKPSVLITT